MNGDPRRTESRRTWVVDALLGFVLLLWLLQLFLLMTGLDAFLGGQAGILWPAAITSIILAALNVLLARRVPTD